MQWHVVNTLFQEMKSHHSQKDGSKGRPNWARIGSCNLFFHGKYGVEIRIESVNEDNSHSWVRISHGSEFLMDQTSL